MFNNLIESSSHARELKRRSSFFLYTIFAYSLLFAGGGVASIYAYDAHLDEQAEEIAILTLTPIPLKETSVTPVVRHNSAPNAPSHSPQPTRPISYESTNNSFKVPEKISVLALAIPPTRPGTIVGPTVSDPPMPGGSADVDRGYASRPVSPMIVEAPAPPPPPVKKQAPPKVKDGGVLNGKALLLPKPAYPTTAVQIHLAGMVSVQVLIDETGKVVSARAVSGHPLLVAGAVRAAFQARFSPTTIGDTPVKVSGIINYNFVLQ